MNREIIVYDDKHSAPVIVKNLLPHLKKSGMSNLMNKQVNHMNKWMQVLLFGAGIVFSAASFAQETTHSVTLQWDAVEFATSYRLEERLESASTWTQLAPDSDATVSQVSETSIAVSGRAAGEYVYRVIGCVTEPATNLVLCDEVAQYSDNANVTLPLSTPLPINIETPTSPVLAALPDEDTTSTAIGTLGGEFRVDESGAATYTVPIALPQGIAGVTPQLALSYSSAAGNGAMGVGWNVSGLSGISRCRQTTEQDIAVAPLSFTNADRFCLDGQKLFAIEGAYGANNTQYRTEIDSQTRVTSYGVSGEGPSHFTVERVDGSISYYGTTDITATSRIDSTVELSDRTIVSWLITSTSDNIKNPDNSIYFHYLNGISDNIGNKEIVVDYIEYSGNVVDFKYRHNTDNTFERSDKPFAYLRGEKLTSKALLDDIIVNNHDPVPIMSYHLGYNYDPVSGLPRVEQVQQCDGEKGRVCLKPTTFFWNDQASLTSFTVAKPPLDMGGTLVSQLPFDLNGDGYSDLVYVVSTHGHYELRVSYNSLATLNGSMLLDTFNVRDNEDVKLIPLDIDGDGQMEIVYYHDYAGKNRWIYYDLNDATISKVQDDRTGIIFTSTDYIKELNLDTTQTGSDVMFHDVNADAYADMLYLHEGKNYIALNNTEGGFDTRKEVSVDLRLSSSQSLSTASTSSFTQSKTSGNNVMETLTLAEAFNKYKLIKPQQFAPVNEKVTVATTSADITSTEVDYFRNTDISALPSHLPPMDMNNDGVADLILRLVDIYDVIEGQVESNYFEYYWMAFQLLEENGEYRYEPIAEIPNSRTNGNSTLADNIFVNDINADGLADVVYRNDNNALAWNVHFGTGVGFTNGKALALTDYAGQALSADDVTAMQLLDINADGQSDIVYFNKDRKELRVLYRDGEAFTSPTVLYTFSAFNKDNDGVLLADWDGDGVLGFARSDFTNNKFYYHRDAVSLGRYPGNRIRTISNGFGIDTDIDYSVLTNSQVYQKGTGAKDLSFGNNSPVFDLIAPSYVVSHVTSDAPSSANAGATVTVMYQYEAMRAQAGGRGMLGFEKIRSYDIQTEVTTETLYHQDFPYIGMPKETRRYLGRYLDWDTLANNQKLSFARNTYNVKPLQGGKTQFPYLASSTETQYSLVDAGTSTTEISTVTTTNTYAVDVKDDNHANLTRVVVSTMDAAQTVASTVSTTNTYDGDNVDNWWLGRVTNTKVTHHRPAAFPAGRQTVNRESDFVYSTTTGMLEKEIIQPGDSDTENLTTLHCYDNLGNKIESITYAGLDNDPSCSAVSALHESSVTLDEEDPSAVLRRSFTIFDTEERRYVNQRGNDKFIAGTVNTRNAFGQATNTTDINGVVSLAGYDSFGAQYASSNSLGMSSHTSRRLAADASTIVAPTITEAYYFVERTRAAGAPTSYAYFDKVGRQVAAVKQSFAANTWVYQYSRYDSYGRVVAQSVPSQSSAPSDWAYTDYDKFGRAQLITSADNTDSTVEYNGLTTTTKVTFDGGTQQSIDVKNILGETVFVSDNADGEIQYFYDATGNLTKVIGVDNVAVTTTFDDLGRKTQMVDPDKGTWNYTYNAAGELITQTSANLHKTTFYRDSVGRTTKRVVSGGSPAVSEITKYSFTAHRSKGECQQISSTNASCDSSKPSKAYGYDNVGRVIMLGTQLDGDIYYQSTTYDQYGRIFQQFDAEKDGLLGCVPSSVNGCWGIKYNYTSAGYLLSQEEARFSASAEYRKIYYQVDKMDALGNVTEFVQNAQDTENKTTTLKGYHQDTGYLATINVTNGQNQDVVNHIYTFDAIGNLRERDNISSGFTETFGYDELNRLLSSTGGPIEDIALTYAANGNILTKSDLQGGATYDYGVKESQCAADTRNVSAGAHAVTSVGTLSYCYDKNGNQTQAFKNGLKTRNIQYSHFDKPSLIDSNGSTAFSYDNGRNRYKRVTTENNLTTTTYYLGNLELISKSDGSSETRRYLPGAIETRQGNGNSTVRYLHKDHLGSIDTITNEAGEIVEKLYFDAWGNKHRLTVFNDWSLDAQNAKALTLTDVLDLTPRGFTGHEHVDHAGIIHMNGRIYDPTLGRFLQADPIIQAPKNSQSFNRYSYVFNNPLSYTDPSGFSAWTKFRDKFLKPILSIALTIWAPWGTGLWASIGTGFVAGGIATGSLKGALVGAFTAGAFHGVGTHFEGIGKLTSGLKAAKVIAHGVVGGISSVLSGGKFGHGFASAGLTQSLSGSIDGISTKTGKILASAVVGGTVSKITGGKFANGAVTGAFSRAFNEAAHPDVDPDAGKFSPASGEYTTDNGGRSEYLEVKAGSTLLTDQAGNSYSFDHEAGIANFMFEAGNGTTTPAYPEAWIGGQRIIAGVGYRAISGVTRLGPQTFSTFAIGSTARDIWKIINLSPRLLYSPSSFFRARYYWGKSGGNFGRAVQRLGAPNSQWDRYLLPLAPIGGAGILDNKGN